MRFRISSRHPIAVLVLPVPVAISINNEQPVLSHRDTALSWCGNRLSVFLAICLSFLYLHMAFRSQTSRGLMWIILSFMDSGISNTYAYSLRSSFQYARNFERSASTYSACPYSHDLNTLNSSILFIQACAVSFIEPEKETIFSQSSKNNPTFW